MGIYVSRVGTMAQIKAMKERRFSVSMATLYGVRVSFPIFSFVGSDLTDGESSSGCSFRLVDLVWSI